MVCMLVMYYFHLMRAYDHMCEYYICPVTFISCILLPRPHDTASTIKSREMACIGAWRQSVDVIQHQLRVFQDVCIMRAEKGEAGRKNSIQRRRTYDNVNVNAMNSSCHCSLLLNDGQEVIQLFMQDHEQLSIVGGVYKGQDSGRPHVSFALCYNQENFRISISQQFAQRGFSLRQITKIKQVDICNKT